MSHDVTQDRLQRSREELLDFSLRNRLLNSPRHQQRAKTLEIVDERSEQVFRLLVRERKRLYFLPVDEDPADEESADANPDGAEPGGTGADAEASSTETDADPVLDMPPRLEDEMPATASDADFAVTDDAPLPQPDADEAVIDGAAGSADAADDAAAEQLVAQRHLDNHLQTELASDQLQRRLLSLFYDARTIEQEQGVSILYLAVGFLKWYEDPSSQRARYAPLILVPVTLARTNVRSRFRLELADEAICTNLSLQAKLKATFGIELPDIDEDEELAPADYFDRVRAAIGEAPRWEVCPDDIVLGLFAFAKFLLYRDLSSETWPTSMPLERNPLVQALLGTGSFPAPKPFGADGGNLDDLLDPLELKHVVDADSSQALAIEEVRRGGNLVIQGPPGTGKSQTITNMIAAAVNDGRTVLFVAEKMAALEVVKRRLDQVGLGALCLELHSQKAKKTAVLEQLRTTLEAKLPRDDAGERQTDELREARRRLNGYVASLHQPHEPSGIAAYGAMGELIALRGAGHPTPDYELTAAADWSPEERTARQELVARSATLIDEIGPPQQHPWRGLGLDAMLPSDADRLATRLAPIAGQLEALEADSKQLAHALGLEPPATIAAAIRLTKVVDTLSAAPPLDPDALKSEVWNRQRPEILALAEDGLRLRAIKHELREVFIDAAWTTDVTAIRRELLGYGRQWYRLVVGPYRAAKLAYRQLCRNVPRGGAAQWVDHLDALITAQETESRMARRDELGRQAFGSLWRSADSDWRALEQLVAWVERIHALGASNCLAHWQAVVAAAPRAQSAADQLRQQAGLCLAELGAVCQSLRLDLGEAFKLPAGPKQIAWRCPACGRRITAATGWQGKQAACPGCGALHDCGAVSLDSTAIADLKSRFDQWQSSAQLASQWIAYRALRASLLDSGLSELVAQLEDGSLTPAVAIAHFRQLCLEAVVRRRIEQAPELARFQGRVHEQAVDDFCQRDRQLMTLARKQVARRHAERVPRNKTGDRQLDLIRHEINKKRRHLAVRRLLNEAADVVQQIKPVFMMSPMSVAQFLAPGRLQFDLLVMDEASQVRPADALGAIGRARQIVVVGDDQQLPPTRFFNAIAEDDWSADEPAGDDARDLESILGWCNARGVPSRMLRWHYRSRHHSLIAVSNREFYNDNLIVIPSPEPRSPELGVFFRRIAEGAFDRGQTATNRVEARAVAQAVMEHARKTPERTLGVGCFSVAQRDAILADLERLRREQPDCEPFFAGDTAEPFFVKNLENIQGDERDEIYISVGYGRDAGGRLTMNFGPLSADGGQRRLNVLITRARRRQTVFSSITADDIDPARATGRGPRALKAFLEYCQRGAREVPRGHGDGLRDPLATYLAGRLADSGFQVISDVGLTGLYVDLGVVDPEGDSRFCLGIESDGPNYQAGRWARDRDRLRTQTLEDQGWKLLRVWAPDWYYRPDEEFTRLLRAIESARAEAQRRG